MSRIEKKDVVKKDLFKPYIKAAEDRLARKQQPLPQSVIDWLNSFEVEFNGLKRSNHEKFAMMHFLKEKGIKNKSLLMAVDALLCTDHEAIQKELHEIGLYKAITEHHHELLFYPAKLLHENYFEYLVILETAKIQYPEL